MIFFFLYFWSRVTLAYFIHFTNHLTYPTKKPMTLSTHRLLCFYILRAIASKICWVQWGVYSVQGGRGRRAAVRRGEARRADIYFIHTWSTRTLFCFTASLIDGSDGSEQCYFPVASRKFVFKPLSRSFYYGCENYVCCLSFDSKSSFTYGSVGDKTTTWSHVWNCLIVLSLRI